MSNQALPLRPCYLRPALANICKFVLVLMIAGSSARARLGETFEECKARYGDPVKVFQAGPVFIKGDFQIQIAFYDGKAGLIVFMKASGLAGVHEPLSDTEIATLMRANGSKSPWKQEKDSPPGGRGWVTEDGLLFAMYEKNQLWIGTKAGMTRYFRDAAAKEKMKMEGF